jgi:hypothetical protein
MYCSITKGAVTGTKVSPRSASEHMNESLINLTCKGELEVDYDNDTWADHDENFHGPIDTPANRRQFPETFTWSCCDAQGAALDCKTSRHRPNRAKRVRR